MTEYEIALKLNDHDNKLETLDDRVIKCEEQSKSLNDIALNVNTLATNMHNMLTVLQKQGERLECLEKAPLEDYKRLKWLIVGCVVTGVIGAIISSVMAFV